MGAFIVIVHNIGTLNIIVHNTGALIMIQPNMPHMYYVLPQQGVSIRIHIILGNKFKFLLMMEGGQGT